MRVFSSRFCGLAIKYPPRGISSSILHFSPDIITDLYNCIPTNKYNYFFITIFLLNTVDCENLVFRIINTFKYHVSCTDEKISVRNSLLFYLFFIVVPSNTNSEVRCRIHKGSSIIPILSRINPIPPLIPYLFKVHSNIFLPSMPRPPQRSLSWRFTC